MFEKTAKHCPTCGYEFRDELADGQQFVCSVCHSKFRVILDDTSGKAAFYEEAVGEMPEPLFLPKGSIRALVAVSVSAACWALVLMNEQVPPVLLGLILAVLGYYFGFRVKIKTAGSRMFDPTGVKSQPLNLPGGFIRKILIGGFIISGLVLLARGKFKGEDTKYLEFFLVLAGMVAGYAFGRAFTTARIGKAMVLIGHLKGAVVLVAALYLTFLLITGGHEEVSPVRLTALCSVITFYYGSRT